MVWWPFLWDDFDFLGRVHAIKLSYLIPDPSLIFYRPVSREIYFWIIDHLFGASPFAAHVLNAAVVCVTIALLVSFVRRLAGPRAAVLSGLLFACSAALPLSIGWASAGQDLLCAMFAMLALHFQLERRRLASALAIMLALLSKETAVAVLPALVAIPVLRPEPSRREVVRAVSSLAIVGLVWASLQPWVHSMLSGAPPEPGAYNRYIFRGGALLPAIVQGIAISLNNPWIVRPPTWPSFVVLPALIATGLVVLVLARRGNQEPAEDPRPQGSAPRLWLLGALVWAPSIVATSLVLGRWSPHYVTIPALGMSMTAGVLLVRAPRSIQLSAVLVFLWLGVGLRGNSIDPIVPTEPNFRETAVALTRVERGLKLLRPTLPDSSNVFISVQARQSGGIYRHLFRFQPLRIWYRRPNLWVLDPNRRMQDRVNEYLFWIDPELDVYEIRIGDFAPRGPTERINLPRYQKTLRGYAFGLAGAGQVDLAVRILTGMPEVSQGVAAFDRRTAAALLLSAGRVEEAQLLVSGVPTFEQAQSMEAVVALLAEPATGLDLDQAAMIAFGLDPNDPAALRVVMERLEAGGYKLAAGRFARRIQTLVPGDEESAAVIRRVTEHPSQRITVPIPYDIPQ